MGSVFLAQQTEPVKRAVAVKVIKAGMDSRAVLTRFEAERQALALMDHPHIAKVLDAGTTDGGRPFFVMELVKGTPITRYCDEHKLTLRQRMELFVPVCQAIQHAHQKGIIHRDIKPSNVLVAPHDDRPVVKVIDFGVAKATGQALTDKTLLTGFGALVGTPEYMSPEQASLNNLDIDTRSDVYSLGVLLYELLTGTTPVDRKSLGQAALLEILRIVREVEAPRPSAKLSSIDTLASVAANRGTEPAKLSGLMKGELDWLVLKALEKDRTRRYETASALSRDIQRYLADEVVEARPPSVAYRLSKIVRRHKGQVIAASLVLVALVGGIVGTTLGLFEARRQEQIARYEATAKEQARAAEAERVKERDAALDDANHQLDISRFLLAVVAYDNHDVSQARLRLDSIQAKHRGWEWHYLRRQATGGIFTLHGHTGSVWSVAFSPDGTRLVTGCNDRTAKVWDARTGTLLLELKGHTERTVTSMAFSPDGTRLVTGGGQWNMPGKVKVWDARTGTPLLELKGHMFAVESVAFSPDGKRIASTTGTQVDKGGRPEWSGEVRLWDAANGKELLTFSGLPHWANTVAFSPDGKYLAAGLGDLAVLAPARPGEVRVWDAATGREIHNLRGHTFWVTSVAFSPDSRHVASAGADRTVRVWDLKTGQEVLTLRGHSRWVRAVAFSPDGKLLASAGDDQSVKIWDAATGNEVLTLRGHSHPVLAITFCPDSRRLASATGRSNGPGEVNTWDITTSQEARTLRGHTGQVTSVAFSPDSKVLASVSMSTGSAKPGEALLWDLADGRKVKTIRGCFIGFPRVTFSPDGRMIATAGKEGVEFWDRVTGQRLPVLPMGAHPYFGLALSPDGKWVAASGLRGVVVRDRATGKERLNFRAHTLDTNDLTFSPNSRHLVTCTSGGNYREGVGQPSKQAPNEVKVWDVETGKELRVLRGGGLAVVYSPRGEQLASSNRDGSVQVWDSAAGQELFRLGGHSAAVRSLAYSPDGQRIITGSDDYTVKVWDALTGQEMLTLRGHNEPVTAVAFSPDGWQIASGSGAWGETGEVKVWDATPAAR
jgi:WD40 repeat protein